MKTVFNARAVAWALSAMATFAFSPVRSADSLYYFMDEQGVSHFSNVPGDPRYRPLPSTRNPAALQPGLVSLPSTPSVPREVPVAVRVPEAAKGFAEPNTAEPLPEEMVSEENMLTDENVTPDIEVEPEAKTVPAPAVSR
jgi:hypothetical protein